MIELFPIKYRLILVKNLGEAGYEYLMTIKPGNKDILYNKDKQFTFEPHDVSYIKGRTRYQFKDFVTGETVLTHKLEASIDPDDIQQRNKEKLAKKATETTGSDISTLTVIAVAAGALCAGLFIMVLAYPSIFPQMMKPTAATAKLALTAIGVG